MADPIWFWEATFVDGGTVTFYADNKALAWDHASLLARDFKKPGVVKVKRLKHSKDVTATDNAQAGALYE